MLDSTILPDAIELTEFESGFLAGWLRHAGITGEPTYDQMQQAVAALTACQQEEMASARSLPETGPTGGLS